MIEFMSFLTKYYPFFYEDPSDKKLNDIIEHFDIFFNEDNKIYILEKKKKLLDNGYEEIPFNNKDVNFIEIFYNNPNYIKNFYLDIIINNIDKNFLIYKESKK